MLVLLLFLFARLLRAYMLNLSVLCTAYTTLSTRYFIWHRETMLYKSSP